MNLSCHELWITAAGWNLRLWKYLPLMWCEIMVSTLNERNLATKNQPHSECVCIIIHPFLGGPSSWGISQFRRYSISHHIYRLLFFQFWIRKSTIMIPGQSSWTYFLSSNCHHRIVIKNWRSNFGNGRKKLSRSLIKTETREELDHASWQHIIKSASDL